MKQRQLLTSLIAMLILLAASAPTVLAATEQTVTLAVDHMTCSTCPYVVRKALKQVRGVQSAQVDFKTKTAVVTYDPEIASVSDLTTATTDAGYPSKRKE